MAGVDVQSFTAQAFNRVKVGDALDPAGVAIGPLIRDKLGDGANSIIHAEQLKAYAKDLKAAPRRPLMALRGGTLTGNSYDMRTMPLTWWIYDDPKELYWNINGLIPLIERAYPFDCIPFVRVSVTNIGPETSDSVLGWLVRSLQLSLITRG